MLSFSSHRVLQLFATKRASRTTFGCQSARRPSRSRLRRTRQSELLVATRGAPDFGHLLLTSSRLSPSDASPCTQPSILGFLPRLSFLNSHRFWTRRNELVVTREENTTSGCADLAHVFPQRWRLNMSWTYALVHSHGMDGCTYAAVCALVYSSA